MRRSIEYVYLSVNGIVSKFNSVRPAPAIQPGNDLLTACSENTNTCPAAGNDNSTTTKSNEI